MARISVDDLKAKFKTGDIPDGNDFNDFIDSCYRLINSIDENTLHVDEDGKLSVVASDDIKLVHLEQLGPETELEEIKAGITYSVFMSNATNATKTEWLDLVNTTLEKTYEFIGVGFGINTIRIGNDIFQDVKIHDLSASNGSRGTTVGRIYRLYQGARWQSWKVDTTEQTVQEEIDYLTQRIHDHEQLIASKTADGHVRVDDVSIKVEENGTISAHTTLWIEPKAPAAKYSEYPMGYSMFSDYGFGNMHYTDMGWRSYMQTHAEFNIDQTYRPQFEILTNKDDEAITQEIRINIHDHARTDNDSFHHLATIFRKMTRSDADWGHMSVYLPTMRGNGAPGDLVGASGQFYVDKGDATVYVCKPSTFGFKNEWNKLLPVATTSSRGTVKADGDTILVDEHGVLSVAPSLGGPGNEAPQEYFFIDPITPNVPAGMYPDGHSIFLKDFDPSSDSHWVTAFLAISPTVEEAKLINRVIKNEAAGYCAHYVEIYEGGLYRTTLVRFWRYGLEPYEDWSAFSQFDSKGEKGNKGDKGDKGDKGSTVNWLSGEDVPNEAIGEVGDYYIDRLTGNVYHKLELEDEETEWNYEGYSIIGSKGDQGEKGDAFTYEDFTEEQLELLIGPQGENGVDGENGDDGEDGRDGDSILIYRSYDSVADMEADTHPIPMPNNVLGLIANESDADHGKLYAIQYNMDTEEFEYRYILTLSNALAIKGEQGEKGEKGDKGDKGDPFTLVIDDLETDDSDSALSANQGMILNEKIELHKDVLATTEEFGHVKIGSGLVISDGVVSAPEKEAHLGAFSQITCVPNTNYWAHTSDFNRGITNVVTGNNGYITLKAGKVYRITLDGRIEFDSTGSVSLAIYDRTSNSHIIGAYGQWHSNNQNAAWGYANSLDFMLKVPDTTPTRNYSIRCVSANGAPRFGNWSEFRVLVQEV